MTSYICRSLSCQLDLHVTEHSSLIGLRSIYLSIFHAQTWGAMAEAVTICVDMKQRAKCVCSILLYGVLCSLGVSETPGIGRLGISHWRVASAGSKIGADRVQVVVCTQGDIKALWPWVVQHSAAQTKSARQKKRKIEKNWRSISWRLKVAAPAS